MSEGVMTIKFDGFISFFNPAALSILGFKEEELSGRKFASCFFDAPENDEFAQMVLDAVYDRERTHESIVPYKTGNIERQLRVVTSFLQDGGEKVGIIVVFSDLSELLDLRDAVKTMEKIKSLNEQLSIRNTLLKETFGRFLSDDIVRQILDTPDGLSLGGKKREVTILISDLRGFTSLSERMDPSDIIQMLNHYLGEMTDAILKRNGTIIELLGDGILAVFGAPVESSDHAAMAVAAALEMQGRMEDINRWNLERNYPILEMGIGINTGDAIVGNIGSEKSTKYGVVGSSVNLCSRIESYTINGQILISQSTREHISEELTVAKEMVVHPKGVEKDMTLLQVSGIGAPYDISVDIRSMAPDRLPQIIPVTFHQVEGKHMGGKMLYGGIVALAADMAVLDTQAELNLYDNIQIDAGGKLYCKVLEKGQDGYLVHFTSVPSEYENWLNSNNLEE